MEMWLQEGSDRDDPFGVGIGPTHVRLEFVIPVNQPICVHLGLSREPTYNKKPTLRRLAVAWAITTPPDRPFVSNPVNASS
jgi:hypothetical protein